jgi:hypothetical protein
MNASLRPETAPSQLSLSVPAAGPAGQTWWNRNWIRVVVAGCCGAVALFLGGIILIVVAAFAMMRSSGACEEAVSRAESSPAVVQALGTPLEVGWFVIGTLNPGESAEITIPVTGPRGKARIDVVASKATGTWVFSTLAIRLKTTGEQISLADKAPPPSPAFPLQSK